MEIGDQSVHRLQLHAGVDEDGRIPGSRNDCAILPGEGLEGPDGGGADTDNPSAGGADPVQDIRCLLCDAAELAVHDVLLGVFHLDGTEGA